MGVIKKRRKLSICERDRWHCVYCFRYLGNAKDEDITIDHVQIETKRLPGHASCHADGLVLSCLACNRRKGTTPVEEFLEYNTVQLQYIVRQLSIPLASVRDPKNGKFLWELL